MLLLHILLIDDEKAIQRSVRAILERENIQVTCCGSASEADAALASAAYDLILLDLGLPDMDGFEFLSSLRTRKILTPVMILSGRGEEYHKVLGLGLGADDYLTKPFSAAILISKIKAIVRRSSVYNTAPASEIKSGEFLLSLNTMQAFKNGVLLPLTAREFALFRFFAEHPDQVFTKEQLYHQIWNDRFIDDNTIMVYIRRLRNKIEEQPAQPLHIKTVWGIGYQFDPAPQPADLSSSKPFDT